MGDNKRELRINFYNQKISVKKKKSWVEKRNDSKGLPKVAKITGKMSTRWGIGTVAIPAPIEIDALMKKVPKGKLNTINNMRQAIARKHKATIGCPITCGIFAWIAANAADEEMAPEEIDVKFRRQYSVAGFVVDFYCPKLKLAIEIDGDSHLGDEAEEYDRARQKYIESAGIRFLRFTNNDIYYNLESVLNGIFNFIFKGP